ncbi:phospholipase D-like domain-containing protein [Stenotrophomonas sp.]|uniref:phospholipase D-like domain-containing protein n=1 Tax=Stenotrophomonas sp. TaxID=69392 RepID=UPI0028A1287E|nr:phospholipase D-like domain-containing protein [Stenotrophomonas sp.]
MDFDSLDRQLRDSAQDRSLSNEERSVLRELGEELPPDRLRFMRNRAFDIAREQISANPAEALPVLKWVEQVVRTLDANVGPVETLTSTYFSPGDACMQRLRALCASARKTLDICVFTISDDRLSSVILDAHKRGVVVRIISDNDKVYDDGNDIRRLHESAIPVKVDHSEYHMHHKFALFDGKQLANGSFNWTRTATEHNDENLVVSNDPNLVRSFAQQFEVLWGRYKAL